MNCRPAAFGSALCFACLLLACSPTDSPVLDEPPTAGPRPTLVTLSPHLAELVFAAGAGDHLVAVSAYSNYPDKVLALPTIGDAFAVDMEQLALHSPDIVLAWESGTPAGRVDDLRAQGYRVETIRTQSLEDVAQAMQAIGAMTSRSDAADRAAAHFLRQLGSLRSTYSEREPIRVFYQVSAQPLYTVNGSHYVSQLLELCGGENVFADLNDLAPSVVEEAVLVRDPEVLLAGRIDPAERPFAHWERWPSLAAIRFDNRFYVHSDLIGRAGPRLATAGAAICRWLDEGRSNRAENARH